MPKNEKYCSQTNSVNEGMTTVLENFNDGTYYIPKYQRFADQWDDRKKSLFIESILNNLSIPAFFIAEDNDGKSEILQVGFMLLFRGI